MKLGIVGCPGAGKTTVFEALTRSTSTAAGKTETRIGTLQVPDDRVDALSRMYRPRKTIYAQIEYLLPGKTLGRRKAERIRPPGHRFGTAMRLFW